MSSLSDTDPETERVHLELLRSASPERRLRLALSLSRSVIALSRGGLMRGRPGATDEEIGLRFVAYYVPEERVRDAVARRGTFNLIHLETMLKVDVFVSRDRPHDRRALQRARMATVEGRGAGIRVASAEDIVLAKLEWFRRGGEVSERQWADVLGVFRVAAQTLDQNYLRVGAAELRVTDLLERALRESGNPG